MQFRNDQALDSQLRDQQQEFDSGKMGPRNRNKRMNEEVPTRIRPALGVLLEAVHYAEQTSGDCWEFAVEIAQLTALGLTPNDLRWLVRKGLVEHQLPTGWRNQLALAKMVNGYGEYIQTGD